MSTLPVSVDSPSCSRCDSLTPEVSADVRIVELADSDSDATDGTVP